eukprot:2438948-Pleurochrysis_carterae.AAC.2
MRHTPDAERREDEKLETQHLKADIEARTPRVFRQNVWLTTHKLLSRRLKLPTTAPEAAHYGASGMLTTASLTAQYGAFNCTRWRLASPMSGTRLSASSILSASISSLLCTTRDARSRQRANPRARHSCHRQSKGDTAGV